MLKFNSKEYQENLKESEKITDCDRVPVPECAEHQNYIFISYSHKDYKKVYHDLALMYSAGVRFWYDEALTAGYDWDDEVCKKITDPHCSGIIFYLSDNFFRSESICKEILTSMGKNAKLSTADEPKNYFCVNLSDKMPSELIEEADVKSEECEAFFENTDETLKDFLLNTFRDKATYISFGSKGYMDKLIVQIRRNFNVIDLTGDDASLVGEYNGEMLNGKRNGYGVCKYENGNVYLGEWKDNKYQGKGKLIYSEGDSRDYLEGDFSDHKANGACVMKFKNGDCYSGNMTDGKLTGLFTYTQNDGYVYEGEMLSGEKHGKGKLIYPVDNEFDFYDGEWLNNNEHGQGVLKYKDGKTWEGSWKHGKKENGFGFIKYKNGRIFCGSMKDGKLNGKGKLSYPESESWEYYEGEWLDGFFSGNGILKYRDGSSYDGGWYKNNFHGKGKLVYSADSNIEYYYGDLDNGVKKGVGVMKFKNGGIYEGEWNDNQFEGKGLYKYNPESHIDSFEGEYENDKKNGRGIMRFKNGEYYEGEWKDGKYNGIGYYHYNDESHIDSFEGEYQNDKKNGRGIMHFKNGECYNGDWSDDRYNGYGVFKYTVNDNRDYYEGQWLKNKIHGQGILYYKDGTKWEGEWKDGNQHNGRGTIKYTEGSIYCGDIKDGKYSGTGKLIYKESSKIDYYEGDWLDGKKYGHGVMRFRSGDFYEGQWKDDNYNGIGVFSKIGDYIYQGEFVDSDLCGKGVIKRNDGSVYEGFLEKNKYHGKGKLTYKPDSNIEYYEGDWIYQKKNGFGIMRFKDGEQYDGEWKNDEYEGFGKMTYKADNICAYYEGQWQDSKKHGNGTLVYKDGTKWEGEWKEGKRYKGQGTYKHQDGSVYFGEIDREKYNGKGKFIYNQSSTADYYDGDWTDGIKIGNGIMKFKNGNVYQGEWNNNDYNGHGVFTYAPNPGLCERYEGEWLNSEQNGFGTMYYLGGSYYEGQWKNGRYNGEGTFYNQGTLFRKKKKGVWKDGRYDLSNYKFINALYKLFAQTTEVKYTGDLKDGVYHGFGKLIDSNGEYNGEFVNGFRSGKGVQKYLNGVFYEGEWLDNMSHGDGEATFDYFRGSNLFNITLKGTFEYNNFISGTIKISDGRTTTVSNRIIEDNAIYDEFFNDGKGVYGLMRNGQ